MTMFTRRSFLRGLGAAAVALPFYQTLVAGEAYGLNGTAKRLIVFYFPDGVPGRSQDGEASLWHAQGAEFSFRLPDILSPLEPFRDQCVFLNGLSMGGTDAGSHPGGAKKLLTAVDGGGGESIDQYIARTVGSAAPHRHVHLGVQATINGASGDKHLSYVAPGVSVPPDDDPIRAFDRLFAGAGSVAASMTMNGAPSIDPRKSILDGAMADLTELRARIDGSQKAKLDLHLEAFRELEARIRTLDQNTAPPETMASCSNPELNNTGFDPGRTFEPELFPALLRMQTDVMVQAMACGLSRVGVIQNSMHTSELIMSRFEGSEMYDPGYDMRSHQASHYGAHHDWNHREFRDFVLQRKWFVKQFAYLLEQLRSRPEDGGTMLDHSLIWLCTEVSDGNTHSHDDMPFVLAGGGGGAIRTGRLHTSYERHSNLLVALGRAMGADLNNFGQESYGPLHGLLT